VSTLRQFGLELECFNINVAEPTSGRNIQAAIRGMGYPAKHQPYSHFATEYTMWQIKPDSSLRECTNPVEVVSRTLPGTQASIDEVVKVANWLSGNGYDVNHKCGYHIHLDAADMTSYEAAVVALRYNLYRAEIDAILPPSRRAPDCHWARALQGGSLTKVTGTIQQGNTRQSWGPEERYVAVNLQHVAKRLSERRIEFRQHSGTLDATKIIGWYKFLCEFVAETLRLIRDSGGVVASPATVTAQPIVRRQQTRRGTTRSVVTGTTQAPVIPAIIDGTDYDLFLRAIASNGVVTQQDARSFGWPETRLRVTAHWLRRHGAELLTTQRNGELAYVGINGARTRDEIFSAPAQIRRRVSVTQAVGPVAQAISTPRVTASYGALQALLQSTPLLSGMSDETVAWYTARRAAIAAADARRAARAGRAGQVR